MSDPFLSDCSPGDFGVNSKAIYTLFSLQINGAFSSAILARSSQPGIAEQFAPVVYGPIRSQQSPARS
jgi:hypothetical protein